MTWQNLLPSSLGNPSYNKTIQEVPLNKRSRKLESLSPASSGPCPQFEQPLTNIKKGGAIILPDFIALQKAAQQA